jgi:hypothetical protein
LSNFRGFGFDSKSAGSGVSVSNLQLLITCFSGILVACGVASIIVGGWVKSAHVSELRAEIDKLWEQVTRINILETKINSIEKGIERIEVKLDR